ncbi:hypothetical protein EDB92DRAFT_1821069 [Lactarius akahatsu]|uniref:Uncharacterized protein n=1 Tax=Lactarius akahatsu TaxID=416441 RepID=A0AAD4Q7Z2_9AGAM|nr:hypothetical protein EDB92DRAFT_1821069 [Lactarius akahatsu]
MAPMGVESRWSDLVGGTGVEVAVGAVSGRCWCGSSVIAGSRWQWGLGQDGTGAGRVGSGGHVEVGAAWRGQGGCHSQVGRVEGVAAMSRWRGREAAGAGGGVEGATKSLQEREVLPG